VNGWVSASVVVASGDCANVPVVNPPQFQPLPTQAPTQPPAQPTQPLPTQPPSQPTEPPPPPPTEEPSGPCLLVVNSQVRLYTQPIEQADYIYDAVDGGELVPTGRLSGGGWWKTNYAGAWIPTHYFGGAITVTGNCNNLPAL
jgi:hypothetical protein